MRLQLVLGTPYQLTTRPTAYAAPLRSVLCPRRSWGRLTARWKRQRRFARLSILTRQGRPLRVQAPQRGRSFRRSGEPSPASPISARRLHLPPIPQAERWDLKDGRGEDASARSGAKTR